MTDGIIVEKPVLGRNAGMTVASSSRLRLLAGVLAGIATLAWNWPGHTQTNSFTDFEPSGFVDGETVDNHKTDGTEASPEISFGNACVEAWFVPNVAHDEEVVALSDTKVWRFSQAAPPVPLGQNPHSPNSDFVAGETGALNDASCGAPTTASFYGEVAFTSATGSNQPSLNININANSGDTRHAFTRILDDGAGSFDLEFFDTVNGCEFNSTMIDASLDPSQWHTLGIEIFFVDGLESGVPDEAGAFGNDVVNLYVDDTLVHTGTTWESCVGARSIDRLLFAYGTQQAAQDGTGGLYFDDVLVAALCPDDGRCPPPPPEFESVGQCVSTLINENCAGLSGRARAECNHEQQLTCFDLFDVQ